MTNREKQDVAVVLPDGTEYFKKTNGISEYEHTAAMQEALNKSQYRSKYGEDPVMVEVKLFRLFIEDGKIKRSLLRGPKLPAPMERMTREWYEEALKVILDVVPLEFQPYVSNEAYDRGHSAGYEEVLMYAREIVNNLKDPIERFRKNIIGAQK